MATRITPPTRALYEEDFYVWTREQADHLRARRFDALDLDNLIDEVQELGDSKRDAALNNARVVIEHFLKLEHSPAQDPRPGWRASAREHRRRLQTGLTPRLRRVLAEELSSLYAMARDDASAGMRDQGEGAAADALPAACPYTLDQITGDWLP